MSNAKSDSKSHFEQLDDAALGNVGGGKDDNQLWVWINGKGFMTLDKSTNSHEGDWGPPRHLA
jgi:hypothetical protein